MPVSRTWNRSRTEEFWGLDVSVRLVKMAVCSEPCLLRLTPKSGHGGPKLSYGSVVLERDSGPWMINQGWSRLSPNLGSWSLKRRLPKFAAPGVMQPPVFEGLRMSSDRSPVGVRLPEVSWGRQSL